MTSESPEFATRWQTDLAEPDGSRCCAPAVNDEFLLVGLFDGTLAAISRQDGSGVWEFQRTGSLSNSAPTIDDGQVFIGSGGGSLYALDISDGSDQWTYEGSSAISTSPVVTAETVFVGRNDGVVLAVDRETGTVRWERELADPIYVDPAVFEQAETVYFTTKRSEIYALDCEDGRQRWTQRFEADVKTSKPVIDDTRGNLYYAANQVMALQLETGETRWGTSFVGASTGAAPTYDEDGVYIADGAGKVYGVSDVSGVLVTEPDWEFNTWAGSIQANLTSIEDYLLVSASDGGLFLLDRTTGDAVSEIEVPCSVQTMPAYADGELYVAGSDGTIFALS